MAANYQLPATVEKRVRFFDGQFLQDQDFIDEQHYHLDRDRRHNRLLHVAGIADGLAVRPAGANRVTVTPGTAIDSDGRTLALAAEAGVDLPAETFNGVRGIRLYLAYAETSVDQQVRAGSAADTRWLERPVLVRAAPGESYSGATPPVLLAEVSLDPSGTVSVDTSTRQYSGVRLPGPAGDAPVLSSSGTGAAKLAGTLAVDGNVGVGTTSPENAEGWSRVLDVLGAGNTKLSVRTANVDARLIAHDTGYWGSPAAMVIGTKTNHPVVLGTNAIARMVVTNQGRVGIGTAAMSGLAAKLDVQQAPRTGTHPTQGAVKGLYVTGDFGEGSDGVEIRHSNSTQGIGISYNAIYGAGSGADNHVNLLPKGAGSVGVKTRTPVQDLHVNGRMYLENGVIQRGGTKITNTSDLGLYSQVTANWLRLVTSDAPIAFYTDGGIGSTYRMIVRQTGVQIGTSDLRNNQQNSISGGTVADRFYVSEAMVYWEPTVKGWLKLRQSQGVVVWEADGGPSSDLRLKTALRPIDDALDKVLRLRGMRYRWGETGLDHFTRDIAGTVCAGPGGTAADDRRLADAERQRVRAALAGDQIGLIAQDVEPVVPEVVSEDRDGVKHIRYQHLTALLVEAIKEQHALVQAMGARLAAVERQTAANRPATWEEGASR